MTGKGNRRKEPVAIWTISYKNIIQSPYRDPRSIRIMHRMPRGNGKGKSGTDQGQVQDGRRTEAERDHGAIAIRARRLTGVIVPVTGSARPKERQRQGGTGQGGPVPVRDWPVPSGTTGAGRGMSGMTGSGMAHATDCGRRESPLAHRRGIGRGTRHKYQGTWLVVAPTGSDRTSAGNANKER